MLLLLGGAAAAEQRYLADVVDLPLMPGLWEVPEAGLVFDKPEGRIVEAEARGAETAAAVRAYYAGALPPLGWRADGADTYRRDGEVLRLDISDRDGAVAVRFSLAPE